MPKSVNKIDQYVGGRLQLRRNRLGMSREALALLLGMTTLQLEQYENGVARISAQQLLKITKIMHVSPAYFFEGLIKNDASDAHSNAA